MGKLQNSLNYIYLLLFLTGILLLSFFSSSIWSDKAEGTASYVRLITAPDMTLSDFAVSNRIKKDLIKSIFSLQKPSDLTNTLRSTGSENELKTRLKKISALKAEDDSKNWFKIPLKFILWFSILAAFFFIMKNRQVKTGLRLLLLTVSTVVFGVVLGSDPSPMGTVKDAIVLLGREHVIFLPRLIALTVFLGMVVIVNKYICSWGCQFGTLQDILFQAGRRLPLIRQVKLPFLLTNTVRIIFFTAIIISAFVFTFDLAGIIDPFKIFNPMHISLAGGIFLAAIILASLFFYRPWCHFFCPFGLVGWIFEKISIIKVHVNYKTCTACMSCAKACPTNVMSAILKRNKLTIPDCFSCYTCRDVCPTKSVIFNAGKREKPPAGFFNKH